MRIIGMSVLALACGWANFAQAGTKVVVKTETYAVTGRNGAEIMKSMNQNGPRQGLQARAMAATRYDVKWNMDWSKSGGSCRLKSADATLYITYRYPRLAGKVSPDLQQRWKKFFTGVRVHEEQHGRIAQEMVHAAQAAVANTASANDPGCARTQAQVHQRVQSVYANYEGRQRQFDAREHHFGGKVEKLVSGLMAQN